MSAPAKKSPGAQLLAVTTGERFLTREVAEILGVSVSAIRKLNSLHRDTLGASDIGRVGERIIWLYTPEDVERLRAYFAASPTPPQSKRRMPGRGRPSLWTLEESERRNRDHVRVGYHRRRAAELEASGNFLRAAEHRSKANKISKQLAAEAAARVMENQYVRPLSGRRTHRSR